ncbi:MAG: amidohydrolase family protein [Alphaproteobacteria bacterium]|nr:amidohydrolase family protein [Alphaproteobacteria bacterium]MBU1516631.1 amidohydrolase family protein [Alphaproteobacteria bacterium]MBU2094387.1 amidohydrolase family protein [Alphaproteobacteria bacterium]MBU2153272.1 amidohydrolase family protein [Alphaproteobacteria bacterium]MBU2307558.1 amidohydrolase family protein [Alphaproteobacteria bacterium]
MKVLSAGVALFWLAVVASAEAAPEQLAVVANGEVVGRLSAETTGRQVRIDYRVSNNGRGAATQETVTLDAADRPITWAISGTSLFGARVSEQFDWTTGKARWTSQVDQGEADAPTSALYVASDASPWMLGQYARLLLKAPGRTAPVLPSGTLRLRVAKTFTVGDGPNAIPVTAYEISGVRLDPDYVVLDKAGRLFGTLGGLAGGLIRVGYEDQARVLQDVGQEVALERAMAAQKALAHRALGPIRIRNVRVFDPATGAASALSTVSVFEGRITGIEPDAQTAAPSADTTVIDGQGGMLLPGLHDMHAHTTLSRNLTNLAEGITTTLDMGNDNTRLLSWASKLETGELAGPRIIRSGYLEGRSPYSARNGIVAASLPEALEAVRWYADHGYWQIKLYNSIDPDWVKPLAAEAHRRGLPVSGHVPAFSSPDRVLREGYDTIAHVNQLMLGWLLKPGEDTRSTLRLTAMIRAKDLDLDSAPVRTTIALMKQRRAALDTTAVVYERLMLSRSGTVSAGDAPYLDHMPVGYQRAVKRAYVNLDAQHTDEGYRDAFAKVLQTVALLDREGVQLLPGTDTETLFALPRELELYATAGLEPSHILRLATLDSSRHLGRDAEVGRIARGQSADLILVAGDPTRDIRDVRNVRMTMVRGVIYYPSEIYAWMGVRPFASPPPTERRP